jgi:hypothetical protein
VFDFHHRDAEDKTFALSNGARSLEARRVEAAKCDMLCANCHRRLHAFDSPRGGPGRPVGSGKLKMSDEALLECSAEWAWGTRAKQAEELGAVYGVSGRAVLMRLARIRAKRRLEDGEG